jgi:hypothetical protein
MSHVLAKTDGNLIMAIAVAVVIAAAVFVPLSLYRARKRQRAELARDAGQLQPGHVRVSFHTYSGLLVWVTQRTYDVVLPADQAAEMLWGWHKHNLTKGLFAYGGVFVPILSFFEYRTQMKKVSGARQRAATAR